MKNMILILFLLFGTLSVYSQEIKPVAAGDEVVIVKDSVLSLKNTYLAGENRVFLLLDNNEFRIFDEKTNKVFTATHLNRDIKETEYQILLLDNKKIKGK